MITKTFSLSEDSTGSVVAIYAEYDDGGRQTLLESTLLILPEGTSIRSCYDVSKQELTSPCG